MINHRLIFPNTKLQLNIVVSGRNINLSPIYNDKPSADLPQYEIIVQHSSVLHGTRQAFTTNESSKMLKTAL